VLCIEQSCRSHHHHKSVPSSYSEGRVRGT
jgi:hypothetical protein